MDTSRQQRSSTVQQSVAAASSSKRPMVTTSGSTPRETRSERRRGRSHRRSGWQCSHPIATCCAAASRRPASTASTLGRWPTSRGGASPVCLAVRVRRLRLVRGAARWSRGPECPTYHTTLDGVDARRHGARRRGPRPIAAVPRRAPRRSCVWSTTRRLRPAPRRASSGWTTGPAGAATPTARCRWTWGDGYPSSSCPTVRPRPSRSGPASTPVSR